MFQKINYPLKHLLQNPYYPYNQEWFSHDKEDTPDLAKDWLIDTPYLYGLHNGQNAIMFTPGEVFYYCITLLVHKNHDAFEKKILHDFGHLIVTFGTIWLFGLKNQTKPLLLLIWVKKVKNHYSLITVHLLLFTSIVHYAFYAYLGGMSLMLNSKFSRARTFFRSTSLL